jgi:hypothetical protein
MTAQTKSALLLVATLVVGLLIGAFATSAVLNNRLDQLRSLRERSGFSDRMMEVIQPRDDAQRIAIEAVLERSHERYNRARRSFGEDMRVVRDSMEAELLPLLSEEQTARLEEWANRDRDSRRRRGQPGEERRRSDRPSPRDR